jgi:hypothetical protein
MAHRDRPDPEGFRERLKSRTLTDEDIEYLERLLEGREPGEDVETIGGRPVVAHLPHGMDVIK